MQNKEVLKLTRDNTEVLIMDGVLYVGSVDGEAQDTIFVWEQGGLNVNGMLITPVMVEVLKMYIGATPSPMIPTPVLSQSEIKDVRAGLYTAMKALENGNFADKNLADRLEPIEIKLAGL